MDTKDIIALVVDLGLGAAALHLAHSLNRTVAQLSALVSDHTKRITALENVVSKVDQYSYMAFNPMAGRAGKLYRDITSAEIAMEEAIAKLGVPYRIQFPYYLWGVRYFPDFLLPTLKLIIEVDDDSHREKAKKEADEQRTQELNSLGWTVVRCTNQEALDDSNEALRCMLQSVGIKFPIKPICQLAHGLPQKVLKKRTRGELREGRLAQKYRKIPVPSPLRMKQLQEPLDLMNQLTVVYLFHLGTVQLLPWQHQLQSTPAKFCTFYRTVSLVIPLGHSTNHST